jgi:hypothetical protein
VSLAAANLPDLVRQDFIFCSGILASLLAGGRRLLFKAIGEMPLQHGPPTVVELGPFLAPVGDGHYANALSIYGLDVPDLTKSEFSV